MRLAPNPHEECDRKPARAGDRGARVARLLYVGLGLALLFAVVPLRNGRSQTPGENVGPPGTTHIYYPQHRMGSMAPAPDEYDPVVRERRLNALNIERQKAMVSDTNKLLKLARELNTEIAANNTGALTEEQLHKIAEIEKLAKNVKERMAEGVPQSLPPSTLPLALPNQ